MTNLDRIRNMNAEELAKILSRSCTHNCLCETKCNYCSLENDCRAGIKAWLESEVENG